MPEFKKIKAGSVTTPPDIDDPVSPDGLHHEMSGFKEKPAEPLESIVKDLAGSKAFSGGRPVVTKTPVKTYDPKKTQTESKSLARREAAKKAEKQDLKRNGTVGDRAAKLNLMKDRSGRYAGNTEPPSRNDVEIDRANPALESEGDLMLKLREKAEAKERRFEPKEDKLPVAESVVKRQAAGEGTHSQSREDRLAMAEAAFGSVGSKKKKG